MDGRGGSDGDRYSVRSINRAIAVLYELGKGARSGGRSVTEVAEAVGLSKSAAFSILQTLLTAGFVSDTGTRQTRRYLLGGALTTLGELARGQLLLHDIARPALETAARTLSLSVRLGVLEGSRVRIVDRVDASTGVRIDLRMGELELAHCTAVGKAILASLTDEEVRSVLGTEPLVKRTERTISTIPSLLHHLQTIRTRGYAVDDEEDFPGITCIGAAVHDESGLLRAGVSATTIKAGLVDGRINEIGTALIAAASDIAAALGPRTPDPEPAGSAPAR